MPQSFADTTRPVLAQSPFRGQRGLAPPLRSFVLVSGLMALLVGASVWGLSGTPLAMPLFAALTLYGVAVAKAGWGLRNSYPHQTLGLWNVVTLVRLALICALVAAFFAETVSSAVLLMTALVAFCLDGVDGWLARRAQMSSEFGARFDVEVDSLFALILAGLAVQAGLHPLVLLLGLPRYAFGLAQVLYPRLTRAPLPPRFSRKVVCVAQIAVLIVMGLGWLDPELRHGVAVACAGLLVWSFAIDIRALLRASS